MILCEIRELLAHLCNPAQDVFLLCVFGPSVPPTLLTLEWITAFSAFLENNLGRSLEICHIPKECRVETGDINIHVPSSSLSTSSTYLRCSKDFAKLRVLRSQGVCGKDDKRGRRWRGLSDSAINLILDKLIGFVVVNGVQKRLSEAVEVEVIGDDSRAEPR